MTQENMVKFSDLTEDQKAQERWMGSQSPYFYDPEFDVEGFCDLHGNIVLTREGYCDSCGGEPVQPWEDWTEL